MTGSRKSLCLRKYRDREPEKLLFEKMPGQGFGKTFVCERGSKNAENMPQLLVWKREYCGMKAE